MAHKGGDETPQVMAILLKNGGFQWFTLLIPTLMAILMGNMVINDQFLEVITCMFHGMDFTSFRCFRGEEGFVFGVLMGG